MRKSDADAHTFLALNIVKLLLFMSNSFSNSLIFCLHDLFPVVQHLFIENKFQDSFWDFDLIFSLKSLTLKVYLSKDMNPMIPTRPVSRVSPISFRHLELHLTLQFKYVCKKELDASQITLDPIFRTQIISNFYEHFPSLVWVYGKFFITAPFPTQIQAFKFYAGLSWLMGRM